LIGTDVFEPFDEVETLVAADAAIAAAANAVAPRNCLRSITCNCSFAHAVIEM